jgi:site-specific DNA recombinase
MFEWYATGQYSLADVTKMSRAAGMVFRKSSDAVPKATVNKILRNRLYTGVFNWNGKTYSGVHVPLITKELWERVQAALDGRLANRHRKVKHDFAFSRTYLLWPLRLLPRRRDQEGPVRVLSLHRL